jgi:hypothetical protein
VLLCLKIETEPAFKALCFFKTVEDGQSQKKYCQLTSVMFCSPLSTTHDDLAMQALVWLKDDLTYLNTKFGEETSSYI